MFGALQPPPRGCVLKQLQICINSILFLQPPPRGCVLKRQNLSGEILHESTQPPPRGCVLKHS